MSGVPERTLRGWATSKTPQNVPVQPGDPKFLLIRSPGLKLPDGLWMVDGPSAAVPPAPIPPSVGAAERTPLPAAGTSVPRPDIPAKLASPTIPPSEIRPRPAPIGKAAAPAPTEPRRPEPPDPPARRGPAISEDYLAALLAPEETLPETWGFDTVEEERKGSRRHKLLIAGGAALGFAGVAELIDFLMSHVLR
jgi:hypothetical protein